MINFESYDISDNPRYTNYLRLCIQMPSNLSPMALSYYKKSSDLSAAMLKIFDELRNFQVEAEKDLQSRAKVLNITDDDNVMFYYVLEHWEEAKTLFGFVIRVDGKIIAYSIDNERHASRILFNAVFNGRDVLNFNDLHGGIG